MSDEQIARLAAYLDGTRDSDSYVCYVSPVVDQLYSVVVAIARKDGEPVAYLNPDCRALVALPLRTCEARQFVVVEPIFAV